MFVASSKEGLLHAQKLQICLKEWASPEIWAHDVFTLTKTTIENLEEKIPQYDLTIFIFTSDDKLKSRGKNYSVPRDNLIFETGLCYGIVKRERTIIVTPKSIELKLPSDFAGITTIRHDFNDAMSNVDCEVKLYWLNNLNNKASSEKQTDSFEQRLMASKEEMKRFGNFIVSDLKKEMLEDKSITELNDSIIEKVKDTSYLSDTHFYSIAQICIWKKLWLTAKEILKEGITQYETFDDLKVLLIDVLSRIPSKSSLDQSKELMEQFFCIKKNESNKPELTQASIEKRISEKDRIATILNTYLISKEFDNVLSIIESYERLCPNRNQKLVRSKKAFALKNLGQDDQAKKVFEEILADDPDEESLIQLGSTFFNTNKKEDIETGYKIFERIALNNFTMGGGGEALIALASKMNEYNICRKGNNIQKLLNKFLVKKTVTPLLFKAIELDYYNTDVIEAVKQELYSLGARAEFDLLMEKSHAYPEIYAHFKDNFKNYNFETVEYIETNAENDYNSIYEKTIEFIDKILSKDEKKA